MASKISEQANEDKVDIDIDDILDLPPLFPLPSNGGENTTYPDPELDLPDWWFADPMMDIDMQALNVCPRSQTDRLSAPEQSSSFANIIASPKPSECHNVPTSSQGAGNPGAFHPIWPTPPFHRKRNAENHRGRQLGLKTAVRELAAAHLRPLSLYTPVVMKHSGTANIMSTKYIFKETAAPPLPSPRDDHYPERLALLPEMRRIKGTKRDKDQDMCPHGPSKRSRTECDMEESQPRRKKATSHAPATLRSLTRSHTSNSSTSSDSGVSSFPDTIVVNVPTRRSRRSVYVRRAKKVGGRKRSVQVNEDDSAK
jgi:hypothetical protein